MQVTLYKNTSDPKTVSKTLTTIATVSAAPTAAVDILQPSLDLVYSSSLLACNYVYIPAYSRYYYAKLTVMDGQRIIINCNVDPLMSFAAGIRAAAGCIIRSESIGAPTQIIDSKLPIHPGEVDVTAIRFDETPFLTGTAAAVPAVPTVVLSVLNAGGGVYNGN